MRVVSILEGIVERHYEGYDTEGLRVTASKNGKYQSCFSIRAESETQLKQLHEDLESTGRVHMVPDDRSHYN